MPGGAEPDDTVRLAPPGRAGRRGGTWAVLLAALAVCALGALGAGRWWTGRDAPGPIAVATADERAILAHVARAPTVFRLAPNPAVLVLDFPTLAEQGRALNRLAALVEKAGPPRERLLGDAALEEAIRASGATPETYYYGHDYRAADVARFFALAARDGVALTPEEHWVGRLARQEGWTGPGAAGALVSIPRADAGPRAGADAGVDAAMRATIVRHELSHGEFFTVPAYTAHTLRFWREILTEGEREAFRRFLAEESYDPANEELLANEAQAYLVHTPDPAMFGPDHVGIPGARLAALRAAFVAAMPPGWLRDATLSAAPAPGAAVPGRATSPTPRPRRRPGSRPGGRRPARRATLAGRRRRASGPVAARRAAVRPRPGR